MGDIYQIISKAMKDSEDTQFVEDYFKTLSAEVSMKETQIKKLQSRVKTLRKDKESLSLSYKNLLSDYKKLQFSDASEVKSSTKDSLAEIKRLTAYSDQLKSELITVQEALAKKTTEFNRFRQQLTIVTQKYRALQESSQKAQGILIPQLADLFGTDMFYLDKNAFDNVLLIPFRTRYKVRFKLGEIEYTFMCLYLGGTQDLVSLVTDSDDPDDMYRLVYVPICSISHVHTSILDRIAALFQ